MTVEIKKLTGSEIELSGEIPAADFESYRTKVLNEFRQEIEIPGFRKGNAPDKLIIDKVGNEKILFEMAEHAIGQAYPEILKEHAIDAIGRPEVTITKIADNNPLGFKIKTAVMPEIKLPDYQKIAKAENSQPAESTDATDAEVNEVIEEIRRNRAHAAKHEQGGEHNHEDYEAGKIPETELPELTDEFAKSLGNFDSVADLKEKIKQNVSQDKARRAKEKKRLAIMDELIKETKLDLPRAIILGEVDKIEHEMRSQLESMGLKFEDYLAHLKKTIEDLRQDWEPEAVKRAKFGLILSEIAKNEKITADEKQAEEEMKHILEHYQEADPARVRAYVENMLANEEVFKLLENLK